MVVLVFTKIKETELSGSLPIDATQADFRGSEEPSFAIRLVLKGINLLNVSATNKNLIL